MKTHYFVIGPLSPGIGIIIRDASSGKLIIAHKDYAASLNEFISVTQNYFQGTTPSNLRILLFTSRMGEKRYNAPMNNRGDLKSWKDLHQGRSQKEELAYAKTRIVVGLSINKTDNIKAYQHTFGDGILHSDVLRKYGKYTFWDQHLCIDKEGNTSFISPFAEDLWRTKKPHPQFFNGFPLQNQLENYDYFERAYVRQNNASRGEEAVHQDSVARYESSTLSNISSISIPNEKV